MKQNTPKHAGIGFQPPATVPKVSTVKTMERFGKLVYVFLMLLIFFLTSVNSFKSAT